MFNQVYRWAEGQVHGMRPIDNDFATSIAPEEKKHIQHKGVFIGLCDGGNSFTATQSTSFAAVDSAMSAYYEHPSSDPATALQAALLHGRRTVHARTQDDAHALNLANRLMPIAVQHDQLYFAQAAACQVFILRAGELMQADESDMVISSTNTPDVMSVTLQWGDRVLFCTDGVTQCMNADEVTTILMKEKTPQKAINGLMHEATQLKRTHDNVCAAIFDYGQTPMSAKTLLPAHTKMLMAIVAGAVAIGVAGVVGVSALTAAAR